MCRQRARAFLNLKYYNPREVLVDLRKQSQKIAARSDLTDAVKQMRTSALKPLRELRDACVFCYGWGEIAGVSFGVAPVEAQDYDVVAGWKDDDQMHFSPIQIKEVVPARLNAHTSIQEVVNGLARYSDSEDLTVAIRLNRDTPFRPTDLTIPPLKIAALWVFGAIDPEQNRWAIWGNFLETWESAEFSYPLN